MECEWLDPPGVSLKIERYPSVQTAQAPLHDHWVVDGKPYGKTLYTSGTQAERWWSYTGSPLVFELIGPTSAVDSLSSELAFRTTDEMRTGQV